MADMAGKVYLIGAGPGDGGLMTALRSLNESQEKRMRPVWPALELRMVLDPHEERMIGELYGLHQPSVR